MSEQMNPNNDVSGPETSASKAEPFVVRAGTDISMEQLDTLLNKPKAEKKEPAKKEAKAEEVKLDEKPEANTPSKEKKVEATEKKESVDEAEKEQEEVVERKLLKALDGDKEIEIASNAKVTVKVDGEDVQVDVQELVNNYSGKQAWDKKFTELTNEKKEYLEDKGETEKQLTQILSRLNGKDPLEAFVYMAELAGYDAFAFRKELDDKMFSRYQGFSEMTEEEQKIKRLEDQQDFIMNYNKSKVESKQQEQSQRALEAETLKLQETFNVSQDEIKNAKDSIMQNPEQFKDFLGEGQKEPTIKQAVELADALKRYDVSVAALNEVNPELANDNALVDFIMAKLGRDRSLTQQDIVDYLGETVGVKAKGINKERSENVSRKIAKNAKVRDDSDVGEYEAPKRASNNSEPITLDDLWKNI